MPNTPCPFCDLEPARVFHSGELVLGFWDGYPVSPGHALLVPRRHVREWFEASVEERRALTDGIEIARAAIAEHHSPDGFNIGINSGAAAGQTVPHLHLHVIPRYAGDVPQPRGGVRNVIPGRGLYSDEFQDSGIVREHPGVYRSAGSSVADAAPPTATDSTAFGERMLQLLDEGKVSTTYKYAVLLAMLDLCVEMGPLSNDAIPTRRLAERVLELYWPQTSDYAGRSGATLLKQSGRGQAEIVSQIRDFRARAGSDPSESLQSTSRRDPAAFDRLLRTVEWKLIEMPLPRLQVLGDSKLDFLYRIGWDADIRRPQLDAPEFDGHVHLRPGVRDQLVRSAGLLRPLIQQSWTNLVVKVNREATDDARLQEFLFGACRIALDPVRAELRELQNNRCFYCDGAINGPADVDHFIPWARHPDNGIENLVVADPRCNNNKRDFLAAGEHVQKWVHRGFAVRDEGQAQLVEIATRAGWERHPQRTIDAARTIYLRLPSDVRLWLGRSTFVPVGDQRAQLVDSFERATNRST